MAEQGIFEHWKSYNYISIVGKSSTSIPPSLSIEALDTLLFPGVYATQSTRQQNKSHGIPS